MDFGYGLFKYSGGPGSSTGALAGASAFVVFGGNGLPSWYVAKSVQTNYKLTQFKYYYYYLASQTNSN